MKGLGLACESGVEPDHARRGCATADDDRAPTAMSWMISVAAEKSLVRRFLVTAKARALARSAPAKLAPAPPMRKAVAGLRSGMPARWCCSREPSSWASRRLRPPP